MYEKLVKKFTKNHKEIPLFYVMFDLNKYREEGERGSCNVGTHPSFKEDESLKNQLNELVDYIRKNYDMEELVK